MEQMRLLSAAVVMISVTIVINGQNQTKTLPFNVTETCGPGFGTVLGLSSGITSTIKCSILCVQEDLCRSFMFDCVALECSLHDNIVDDITSLPAECGRMYGQIDDESRTPCDSAASCSVASECRGENRECLDRVCTCTPGYSFDLNLCSCVAECSEYGTTFQGYRGYLVSQFNDVVDYSGKTLEECKNYCATITTLMCRSFDFAVGKCLLSSVTALTQPDDFKLNPNFDYYHRNCAQ